MKRANFLFNQIISYENIRLAWIKARKGKMSKPVVLNFSRNVNSNLLKVQNNLKSNPPVLSSYTQFKIFDPKERIISVVPFVDRVMHHAIMNVLEPFFERQFIFHTYACRKNKGSHKAVAYAFGKAKKCRYFIKLDVRKYFDNIDHMVLKNKLEKIIKDKQCLKLLFCIIGSYGKDFSIPLRSNRNDKGLPIGNLTSQFFANFYLSSLDHFVLEKLKPSGYVRYMDDIVIFSDNKIVLKNIFVRVQNFCSEKLKLSLKPCITGNCNQGIPFLGFLISSSGIRLSQKTRKRKIKRLKRMNFELETGFISEEKYSERVKCLLEKAGSLI